MNLIVKIIVQYKNIFLLPSAKYLCLKILFISMQCTFSLHFFFYKLNEKWKTLSSFGIIMAFPGLFNQLFVFLISLAAIQNVGHFPLTQHLYFSWGFVAFPDFPGV